MDRRKSNQRNGKRERAGSGRSTIPTFLIVCEGKETEPNYFKKFETGRNKHIDTRGLGRSNLSLVKEAVEIVRYNNEYEQVWCVFDEDVDKKDKNYTKKIEKAFKLAKENCFKIAFSNESFELWYLLHFAYYDSELPRDQYEQKLNDILIKKYNKKYKKNSKDMYDILKDTQEVAIKNAKKLYDSYKPYIPATSKPCTTVFKLVEELNK